MSDNSSMIEGEIDLEDAQITPDLPENAEKNLEERDLNALDEKALRYWLAHVHGNQAEATYDDRLYNILSFADWVNKQEAKLIDLNQFGIEQYLTYLNRNYDYSEHTKQNKYYTLKRFYDYLTNTLGYRDDDPAKDVTTKDFVDLQPKSKKLTELREEVHYISPEKKEQLVSNVPEPQLRNKLIIRLLWQTGLRQHELANIRVKDHDLEKRRIKIHSDKTHKDRKVWYQPSLDELMHRWKNSQRNSYASAANSDYLFLSHVAGQLEPSRINKIVKQAADNAGIQNVLYVDEHDSHQSGFDLDADVEWTRVEITAHTLRHSYAVQSLKNGMDIKTLSSLMGHGDLDTTRIYLETLEEDDKDIQMKYGAGTESIT